MLNWCTIRSRAARPIRAALFSALPHRCQHRLRQSLWIFCRNQHASIAHQFAYAAHVRRDHRFFHGHGLAKNQRHSLPRRRQHKPIGGIEQRRHVATQAEPAHMFLRTLFPGHCKVVAARHRRQKPPPLRPRGHLQSKAPHSAPPCAPAGRLGAGSESPWREPCAPRSATQSRNQRLIASRVDRAALGIGCKLARCRCRWAARGICAWELLSAE